MLTPRNSERSIASPGDNLGMSTYHENAPLLMPRGDHEIRALVAAKNAAPCASQVAALSPHSTLKRLLKQSVGELPLKDVPAHQAGDLALPLHGYSKEEQDERYEKVSNEALGGELADHVQSVSKAGPFLNITLKSEGLLKLLEEYRAAQPEQLGATTALSGKRFLVDYSSPNIGKALHVGHLGTTLVGQVLSNILEANGATVFRVNHLGDWGTPLGMLQVAHSRWGKEPEHRALQASPSKFYSTLYQRFHEESKENPALRSEAKACFQKLEEGDETARRFFEQVRGESVSELEGIYKRLGIRFDAYIGESYYESELERTCELLSAHPDSVTDDECHVIDFQDAKLGPALIRKSDGATTYLARDVAAAMKRSGLFEPDHVLYVIGNEQSLHMRQLFEMMHHFNLIGEGQSAQHVGIGLITQKGAKISSRGGGAFALEEYLDTVKARAREKLVSNSVSPELLDEVAEQVALGAVYFHQVSSLPSKGCEFDLEKILDFQGKTGPYIQYTAVRVKSLLGKLDPLSDSLRNQELALETPSAYHKLLVEAARFPAAVEQAGEQLSPHPLANYLFKLAQATNRAYHERHVRSASPAEQQQLGRILSCAFHSLEDGLRLLNISVPKAM